jgi:hypothetical protein
MAAQGGVDTGDEPLSEDELTNAINAQTRRINKRFGN